MPPCSEPNTTTSMEVTTTNVPNTVELCYATNVGDQSCDWDNLVGVCQFDDYDCCQFPHTDIGNGVCQEDLDILGPFHLKLTA